MKRIFLTLAATGVLLLLALGITFYQAPLWVADQRIHLHLRSQHVQSNYLEVDGFTIHYFEALPSNGGGQPLILIHGLGSRGEDWSGMIPSLAANGSHVYALDLLGYGRSSHPDIQYTIAEQEKLVADFMQALHLPQADIAGWSMGGWVALKLTLDHPTLVRRLVVYDSAGLYFPATFDETLFTPTDAAGVLHLQHMLTPTPMHLPGFVLRDAIRKLNSEAWVIHRSVRSMTSGHDLLDFQLQRIETPTLVVWGQDDQLIPLQTGEQIHHQIPNSDLLVVQGCGHLAPQECAKPILRGTVQFLTAAPAPRNQEQTVSGH